MQHNAYSAIQFARFPRVFKISPGHQASKSLIVSHQDCFAGMANAVANQILGSILEIARQFSKEKTVDGICSKAAGLPGKTVEDWLVEMERIRLANLAI